MFIDGNTSFDIDDRIKTFNYISRIIAKPEAYLKGGAINFDGPKEFKI